MKRLPSSVLTLVTDALEGSHDLLLVLPFTREVQALYRRWEALRTVLHGIVVQSMPTLAEAQQMRLVASVAQFAREVAEAHGKYLRA